MRPAFFPVLAVLLLAAPAAMAQAREDGIQPLDRLLPEIRRNHPGRFFDAEGPTPDAHYRLKWMSPDGRVEWLDTDARTGRVVGRTPDDAPPPRSNFRGGDDDGPGRFGGYGPPPRGFGGDGNDAPRGRGRWGR